MDEGKRKRYIVALLSELEAHAKNEKRAALIKAELAKAGYEFNDEKGATAEKRPRRRAARGE
jgi:hypothetical protein